MNTLFSPYFWLAILLGAFTLLGIGYYQGHRNGKNACLARQAFAIEEAVKKAQEQAIDQAKAELKTTQGFETARETVRTVYVKIKEKADENIDQNNGYGDCSLDDDGLHLYNSRPFASVPNPPASGLADLPLPGSADCCGRTAGDLIAQQPGALGTVLRVPGETQSAGGMGHPATGKRE
ncbi:MULTISPECIES: hypothetical protein [Nitrosomonas]|uniref:Uncharacterized protein n=1 Tax=Nitrosomonas communis TaxID=44574 RepID=A0A0F7K9G0_9PROT|nr:MULTISPECIES: hypothetical protein [Nitrosomonas]AKH36885.1 hypothetical protein AAW31_02220 [Nitrosomonas communis]TYP83895.1 hypothetical protein BCL69_104021 [Nitrosomonas communis]UVS61991.1 hypothetical protein NX761_02340 [Nitrosomonas sp. PLL12]